MEDFIEQYKRQLMEEEQEKLSHYSREISEFQDLCSAKGIILPNENFLYIRTIGIVAIYPGLLSSLYTDLPFDKENLLNIDNQGEFKTHPIRQGVLSLKNHMVLSSPFFRRGFNEDNNYAPSFLELFWNLRNLSTQRYISLDENRVKIDINGPIYFEKDTWYGAKFDKSIMSIPDGNVKLRPPVYLTPTHIKDFFGDAYSLDIKWKTKASIKSFQLEEFKTEKIVLNKANGTVYPVRYVHAEYDLENSEFRHFDGAIHFYTEEEYYARRDSDFNYNSKNAHQIKTDSIKLFKINGKIPVETWSELTSHFLHGNPLILEYFEGKYPKYIVDFLARLKELGRGGY